MKKSFLDDDFLLESETARRLYHEYAKEMPIFDFHCHLPPAEIAENRRFENLTSIWLAGDHYKWRAMRAQGVPERFITGEAADFEKFEKWAATVPYTIRNPLFHWTYMELKDPFGITGRMLDPSSARKIYDECTARLQTEEFRARGLLRHFNVKAVVTTDDPCDGLEHHQAIARDHDFPVRVVPAWRPDNAMAVENIADFNVWVDRLEDAANLDVVDYASFLEALRRRHDFFHEMGCRISDHGIEEPYAEDYTDQQIASIFTRARRGGPIELEDIPVFKSAVLFELALMDAEKGWVQQFHLGALRNNNTRMMGRLGPNAGYDSIGDLEMARPLIKLLDRLDREDRLAKTILYNLNPAQYEVFASIMGSFQDGIVPGKMQLGSGWWFNDQKQGMERQIDALSNIGLLARFVGMVTDSRSFLSFPRHEYFRRVLCNLIGRDVEKGELPADVPGLGGIVQDICFRNAEAYFGLPLE